MIALFALVFLVALTGMALGLVRLFSEQTRIVGIDTSDMKAFYLAEAGRARARYMLTTGAQTVPWPAAGTFTESPFGANNGTYSVNAVYSPSTSTNILITSTGYFPNSTAPRAQRVVTESGITKGGGNLSRTVPGVAISASTSQGANLPAKAIDGSTGTKWKSNANGAGQWLRLNYGSTQSVNNVKLVGRASATTTALQRSNNGTSWTAISATESPVGSGNYTFTAVSCIYIRAVFSGNRPEIQEFETYGSGGTGLSKGTFATSG